MKPEQICPTMPFDNGTQPSWSRGNSTIVRVGTRVFVTNAHVHPRRKPYNRTTLEIWEKEDGGTWNLVFEDTGVYQREPSPIAYIGNNKLAVTANVPAAEHAEDEETMDTDCIPTLYIFDISGPVKRELVMRLPWDRDDYTFWEHSYRGFAYDQKRRNLFLDNIEYDDDRFCYTLLDRDLNCIRCGKLNFPARCCYHTIAIQDGETYLFAIQDIKEPVAQWRDYKRQMTGRQWDYDFRKIYLNYCADIEHADFEPSVLICDRDATCGWMACLDCCFDKNGNMMLLVSGQNVYPSFMRERFFPDVPPESTLELFRFSKGKMIDHQIINRSSDGMLAYGYNGFFHTAENGDVYLIWCKNMDVQGDTVSKGTYLSRTDDLSAPPVRLMDETGCLTGSKTRLGAAPSNAIDITWHRGDEAIMYAGCQLDSPD